MFDAIPVFPVAVMENMAYYYEALVVTMDPIALHQAITNQWKNQSMERPTATSTISSTIKTTDRSPLW